MSEPGPKTELLGKVIYQISLVAPFLPTYLHLIISALFPIYTGAHASLSRPSSAAKPSKKKRRRRDGRPIETSHKMEGLSPSDAILYPLMTGCVLASLYFLIKWLQDPEILNKILNWYLSIFGTFAISKLLSDCLTNATSFVFPCEFYDGGLIWELDAEENAFRPTPTGPLTLAGAPSSRESPLPGVWSRLPLQGSVTGFLWQLRKLLTEPLFVVDLKVRGIVEGAVEVAPHAILSTLIAVASVAYFNLVDRPWWLTNLMGFSFSYSALQLMSPTTFWTGTLLLTALFFYDIYFVFFTPMMITVATKLDIPVKLLFPRPHDEGDDPKKALAMLGLGDVVLPGIMIGLALRFDLYAFYLKKQMRREPIAEQKEAPGSEIAATTIKSMDELHYGPLVYGKDGIGKAEYKQATGNWGERFWLGLGKQAHEGSNFPKTYFYASVIGYIIGMVTTVSIMHIFKHGQPALLYLVPGVLLSLWGTALFRGEIKMMWNYTEVDEEEENKEKAKAKEDAEGKDRADQPDIIANGQDGEYTPSKRELRNNKQSDTVDGKVSRSSTAPEKPEKPKSFFSSFFSISITRSPLSEGPELPEGIKLGDTLKKDLKRVSKGPVGTSDGSASEDDFETMEAAGSPTSGEFIESRKKPEDGPGMKRRRIA